MIREYLAGGTTLGWNKSMEFIMCQSYVLNVLYYATFGCSRHFTPCPFWPAWVAGFVLPYVCIIKICNIFHCHCAEFVWLILCYWEADLALLVGPWWILCLFYFIIWHLLTTSDMFMAYYYEFQAMGQYEFGYSHSLRQLMSFTMVFIWLMYWQPLVFATGQVEVGGVYYDGTCSYSLSCYYSRSEIYLASEMGIVSTISKACFQNAKSWPALNLRVLCYQCNCISVVVSWICSFFFGWMHNLLRPLHFLLLSQLLDGFTEQN